MHQKKSEVQIGKESSGVSSDFNPTPIHYKHPQQSPNFHSIPQLILPLSSVANPQILIDPQNDQIAPSPSSSTPKTTPHKRPLTIQTNPNPSPSFNSLSKTPTLSNSLHKYPFSSIPPFRNHYKFNFPNKHLRLILLISLPFFYFLVSHPSRLFVLDFLTAFAFSAALLFSLNLAVPRLPYIRLFLSRSFPIKLSSSTKVGRPPLPVFWSIGSRPKSEKRVNSGCWVQIYSNGDVYEGEFHSGKCSGSGVYYYYMSGRFEGDWIDGKYDGFGVETWARGSRYRGQYRQGLRHGFGVYRFYAGDVYAGAWSNGQSHGCGLHTCEDGSWYVGEFKWGIKHGLGHYHFR